MWGKNKNERKHQPGRNLLSELWNCTNYEWWTEHRITKPMNFVDTKNVFCSVIYFVVLGETTRCPAKHWSFFNLWISYFFYFR